jgi:hypothetical protein
MSRKLLERGNSVIGYGEPKGKSGCGTAQCGKSARWEMEGINPLAVTGREWDATPLP